MSGAIVTVAPYPSTTTTFSVTETAKRARASALSPDIRAWVVNQIKAEDQPIRSKLGLAQLIYDAVRRDMVYLSDPVGAELIVDPQCSLASCGTLKIGGGDCDDITAAYVSACESAGIVCCVVGQCLFRDDGEVDHVLAAVSDGRGGWVYADVSNPSMPFGVAKVAKREVWVGVPSLNTLCDVSGSDVCDADEMEAIGDAGMFVGVSSSESADAEWTPTPDLSGPMFWWVASLSAALGLGYWIGRHRR